MGSLPNCKGDPAQIPCGAKAESPGRLVPALGFRWLTPLYDGLLRLGGREMTFKDRLIDEAAVQPGEAILDLGCGSGTLAIRLKQRTPTAEVVGLDGDPDVLTRARDKASRAGVLIHLSRGLSWALPYPDGTFNVVLSTLFFHHLDRRGRLGTLKEVRRVLRPGGRLHIADWGHQRRLLMQLLSFPDRLLDGIERTADSFAGLLPVQLGEAGLVSVNETGQLDTVFGCLTFYAARNPS